MLDELGGFDAGFRLYGEDIDLQYRAMRAGWGAGTSRPPVRHEHKAVTAPRFLTATSGMERHPPLRTQASRGCARYEHDGQYDLIAAVRRAQYADPAGYSARRAVVAELGRGSSLGQRARLCCADGIMAGPLTELGLRYVGVDASENMLKAARRRNPGSVFVRGLMEKYEPPEPVDLTICLRSFYLAEDQVAFFARVGAYTKKKLVFDFWPSVHPADPVVRDLRTAGFSKIELRPFFTQRVPPRRSRRRDGARADVRGRSPPAPRRLRVLARPAEAVLASDHAAAAVAFAGVTARWLWGPHHSWFSASSGPRRRTLHDRRRGRVSLSWCTGRATTRSSSTGSATPRPRTGADFTGSSGSRSFASSLLRSSRPR
jgi:hypothetical protein